ncbi:MAG: hypothetical protein AB8I08_22455 [Sandaracinaceae bacterium]
MTSRFGFGVVPSVLLGACALVVGACGGGARTSADLRSQLAEESVRTLRERAPDLVAGVDSALDAADRADQSGDREAAADHVTRARLLLDAARAEAARMEDDDARRALETQIAEVLARAHRDERARAEMSRARVREASAATAREEAQRALAQATADEGRPGRRRRVTLDETSDVRRGAAALRERAGLLLAAALALGAPEAAGEPVEAALRASRASRDPLEALQHADEAHAAGMRMLGAARAGREAPGRDGANALAEAAELDHFGVLTLDGGVAVEATGMFSGSGSALSSVGRTRVSRLAVLLAAHPIGPVQVQVQVARAGSAGERLATQRAEALVRALVAEGVDEARLTARGLPPAMAADPPADATRVVFLSYVP